MPKKKIAKETASITSPFTSFHIKVPDLYTDVFVNRGKANLCSSCSFEGYRNPSEKNLIILVFHVCRNCRERFLTVVRNLCRENNIRLIDGIKSQ